MLPLHQASVTDVLAELAAAPALTGVLRRLAAEYSGKRYPVHHAGSDLTALLERGYVPGMTQPENVTVTETASTTTEVPATTEVAVEKPAKTTDTVEVAATPETAGAAQPDAATEAMEVDSKEG